MSGTRAPQGVYALLSEIKADVARLAEHIGQESNGGSGLTGRVMKAESKLDDVIAQRNKMIGAFAAVGLLASLLILGAKAWLQQVLGAHG